MQTHLEALKLPDHLCLCSACLIPFWYLPYAYLRFSSCRGTWGSLEEPQRQEGIKGRARRRRRRIKVQEGEIIEKFTVNVCFFNLVNIIGCHDSAIFNAFMGSKFQTDSKSKCGVDGHERRKSQYSKQSLAYLCACVGLIEDRQGSSDHQAKFLEDHTY